MQVLVTELLGQRQDLRIHPMDVPDVQWEANCRIFENLLFHIRFGTFVHRKTHRLSIGVFTGRLRNIVTSVPDIKSDQVDKYVDSDLSKSKVSPGLEVDIGIAKQRRDLSTKQGEHHREVGVKLQLGRVQP